MTKLNSIVLERTKQMRGMGRDMSTAFEHIRVEFSASEIQQMTAREFQATYWMQAGGPYVCSDCQEVFKTPHKLGAHRRIQHPGKPKKPKAKKKKNGLGPDVPGTVIEFTPAITPETKDVRKALLAFLVDVSPVLDKHAGALKNLLGR